MACNDTEDTDVFFCSRVTRITKHHFRLATIVKHLLRVVNVEEDLIVRDLEKRSKRRNKNQKGSKSSG